MFEKSDNFEREWVKILFPCIKEELTKLTPNIKDKAIQIKITEVNNMLSPLGKVSNVGDNELINLLQYFSLLEELVKSNG